MSASKNKQKPFASLSNIKYDLKAGLIVFLVALPLCLGIAQAQKVDLFSGLISGVIGGIVVGAVSKSKLSISGPAAGLTTIVIASIATFKDLIPGHSAFGLFLTSLCIAGLLQVILGFLKAGIIGYYFPSSVIKGMLCGIGILLIAKEIPHFLGDDRDPQGDQTFIQEDKENTLTEIMNAFKFFSPGVVLIGSACLFILILWQSGLVKKINWLSFLPGPLVAVITGVLMNQFFIHYFPNLAIINSSHLVNLPSINSTEQLISKLQFPDLSGLAYYKVWETGFLLCCVASLESLLSVEAIDKLDPENDITPTNRELIAQGIGNFICGLIGGLPVTSVIVRGSANVNAGAKSKFSAIFHGVLLLTAIFLIPSILNLIPSAALAAILIVTGFKLTRPSIFRNVYKQGWDQFLPFIITIIIFLLTDLLRGVSLGIVVGIIFILRQNYRNPFKLIQDNIDGTPHFFIKLSQNVTFLNKGKIVETLHNIPPGSKVYIDGGRSQFVDKDVLEAITEFKKSAHLKNIIVDLEGIQEVELISSH
jgi:MFS superfamily sulfate permease-like transporter